MMPHRQPGSTRPAIAEQQTAVTVATHRMSRFARMRPLVVIITIAVAVSMAVAGARVTPASAETDDGLDFNTFRLSDNPFPGTTGRSEPPQDSATLYFNECIYRSVIGACTALIESQKNEPRANAWSRASAYRARAAMFESRRKPCSALADYRAALALHPFPGLHKKIAEIDRQTDQRCSESPALIAARNGQRNLRSYNERWRTEAYSGVPPNSRQVFASGPARLRPAIFSDDFSPVVMQQADLRRSGLDRSNTSLFNVQQSPMVVTSNGRMLAAANTVDSGAKSARGDGTTVGAIVTGSLHRDGGGLNQTMLFITMFAFTLSAYLMGTVLSRGYQLTADMTGWVTALFDQRRVPIAPPLDHGVTRDPFLLQEFGGHPLDSGGAAPMPPPLPGSLPLSHAALVEPDRNPPEPVARMPKPVVRMRTENAAPISPAVTGVVDDDPFAFFVAPASGARTTFEASPDRAADVAEPPQLPNDAPIFVDAAAPPAAPLPVDTKLHIPTAQTDLAAPAVPQPAADAEAEAEAEAKAELKAEVRAGVRAEADPVAAIAAELDGVDGAPVAQADNAEWHGTNTRQAVTPIPVTVPLAVPVDAEPQPAPLPSILRHIKRALHAPRVLRHISTPQLEKIIDGEGTLLVIDGEGLFAEQLAALRAVATDTSGDRLILIDPSDAGMAGVLNPFRSDLSHPDALIARNRFNAAVDGYSLIFEHVLGAAAVQENRIALRRLMEIMHRVPQPSFATLRDMVTTHNRSTLVQHASLLGLDACAAQLCELCASQTFHTFLDRIDARLTFMLSDRTFAAATRFCGESSGLGVQIADGRLVVLSNRFAKLGAARCSTLTTSLLMLAAFRPVHAAHGDRDTGQAASCELPVITTDLQRLLGSATTEAEQLFRGFGVGHLHLMRA